ncbi:hypothetical protein TNCV_3186011 [Trichonephila clavipes]|nr:hypothetical protein TNCV_3186011 [Trichonephila clavipes]
MCYPKYLSLTYVNKNKNMNVNMSIIVKSTSTKITLSRIYVKKLWWLWSRTFDRREKSSSPGATEDPKCRWDRYTLNLSRLVALPLAWDLGSIVVNVTTP